MVADLDLRTRTKPVEGASIKLSGLKSELDFSQAWGQLGGVTGRWASVVLAEEQAGPDHLVRDGAGPGNGRATLGCPPEGRMRCLTRWGTPGLLRTCFEPGQVTDESE